LGERRWKRTDRWPPPGVRAERWHLAPERRLSPGPPPAAAGADDYEVDFRASTGTRNRWRTLLDDGDVAYPGRARSGGRRIAWTGEPLAAGIEITGNPRVRLFLRSSAPDAALYAYLEAVLPSGRAVYLTEGQLRLVHHELGRGDPPYASLLPWRSFAGADARPLVPGERIEVVLGLLPTSVRLPPGAALRLSIAGHDADTFRRIPERGPVRLTIERGPETPSWLELPVAGGAG
ncbi:MAG TPA: CocE/NonD family hydrolase, partial [Myxococcota bacterium]|nr:CocE/NonD family hydrolase [Myxococcota bacterium]